MRTVIVTDNPQSARDIQRGLRSATSCRVLGYVDAGGPCGAPIREAGPNIVVIDDPREPAVLATRVAEVRQAAPQAKIILLTSATEPAWLSAAVAAGIDAAISKSVGLACIGILVGAIAAGAVFNPFAHAPTRASEPTGPIACLTRREREILCLVAAGRPNSRIAAELWVTEQTVKFHLSNIYRKLGVRNRTEASHFAHLHALVDLEVDQTRLPSAA